MAQPISTLNAEKNLNTKKKLKENQRALIPSWSERSLSTLVLSREIAQHGNKTDDLFLEYYCLFQIASTLNEQMDPERTLTTVKKLIRKNFPVDQYALLLLNENDQELVIRSQFGFPRQEAQQACYPIDDGLFGAALKRRRPVYIPDIRNASSYFPSYPGPRKKRGAFLALPLMARNDRTVGIINLFRRKPNSFAPKEIDLLSRIARQIGKVIDTISIYQHTRELSITDELTKIFNRRYFNQRYEREIQRAQRYGRALCLIMLDIDHFKIFNDTHGHLLGDAVLKQVAQILEENLRKADILARFGGEEFVVVLPEIDKEHGRKAAEKLRRAVERSHFSKGETQPLGRITVSLGLAAFPEDSREANELIALADKGLYVAKSRGRNQVGVYEETMRKYTPHERLQLMANTKPT